jgi:Domain of unknown function (DUF4296)
MSILPPKIEFRLIMTTKGLSYLVTMTGILFMSLTCLSCGEGDKDAQPILTKPQMVKALMEIYLSEQKINRLGIPRDSAEHEFERFKQVIFKNIGVSDSVFKQSFDYYMDRPVDMEQIYTALVDSLSLMEQRLDSTK